MALCFACKPNALPPVKPSFRDSVAKHYLHLMDSLPFHDSTTECYKMLHAYVLNDTAGLKALQESMKDKMPDWQIKLDSCFKIKDFNEIKGEEVYRFSYMAAFCLYSTVTTVVKSKDSVFVNTLVYQNPYRNTNQSCNLVELNELLLLRLLLSNDKKEWF